MCNYFSSCNFICELVQPIPAGFGRVLRARALLSALTSNLSLALSLLILAVSRPVQSHSLSSSIRPQDQSDMFGGFFLYTCLMTQKITGYIMLGCRPLRAGETHLLAGLGGPPAIQRPGPAPRSPGDVWRRGAK